MRSRTNHAYQARTDGRWILQHLIPGKQGSTKAGSLLILIPCEIKLDGWMNEQLVPPLCSQTVKLERGGCIDAQIERGGGLQRDHDVGINQIVHVTASG